MSEAALAAECPAPVLEPDCSRCGGSGKEPPPGRLLVSLTLSLKTVSEANTRKRWEQIERKGKQRKTTRSALWRRSKAMLTADPGAPEILGRGLLEVVLTRITPSARGLDDDNLGSSFKAIRDETATWLCIDDRDPRVKWSPKQEKGPPKTWAIRIEIRERTRHAA